MSSERKPTLNHRLEYAGARVIQALICALPGTVAREFGACAGRAACALGVRRDVVARHLRRVFGGARSDADLRRIAVESYASFGRMAFEYAWFPRLTRRGIRSHVSLVGREHLDLALGAGRGAVLVGCHFGNWEMLATLATMGYPLTFLVGAQHNALVDGLMNRLRARFGVEIIPITGSLTGAFRALRRNRLVALLSDQDAGPNGVFVDFLGLPASTPYGPARFAAATGAALIPWAVVRRERGRHEIVMCPAVEPPPGDAPGEEAVRRLTQGYTSAFEELIRQHPEQYFWMHRRWKTRPPGAPRVPS
jgi:KDO2-lipid IV(A) lauroyltransferase